MEVALDHMMTGGSTGDWGVAAVVAHQGTDHTGGGGGGGGSGHHGWKQERGRLRKWGL